MKILVFSLMMGLVAACNGSRKEKAEPTLIELPAEGIVTFEVFQNTDSTWGYDIMRDGKKLIHQPHMPTIQGSVGFKNEQDAEAVANLVTYKVNNNIMPPSVSMAEMDSLNISY